MIANNFKFRNRAKKSFSFSLHFQLFSYDLISEEISIKEYSTK
jgi:hypothetical protein